MLEHLPHVVEVPAHVVEQGVVDERLAVGHEIDVLPQTLDRIVETESPLHLGRDDAVDQHPLRAAGAPLRFPILESGSLLFSKPPS